MRLLRRRTARIFTRLSLLATTLTLVSTGLVVPAGSRRPHVTMRSVQVATSAAPAQVGWTRTLDPGGAELVAAEWDDRQPGAVDVRVRQGGKWLPWTTIDGDPEEGPDPGSHERHGTTTAGPAWAGKDAQAIQVRVAEGSLRNLKVHLIHSPAEAPPAIRGATADPAWPGIISRAQWGADEGIRNSSPGCGGNPEYASTVRNAFVHHTVNVNTYSAAEAYQLIRGIYQFHVQTNKWCDIGYNFLVDRFGRVFEGRYGGVDRAVIGAHAGGFNTGSTGAAVLGDFTSTAPSDSAMSGLRNLLAWKLAFHGVDPRAGVTVTSAGSDKYPSGAVVTLPAVVGHRAVSQTGCPGGQLDNRIDRLASDVQAAILSTPPYPRPGWTPVGNQPKVLVLNGYGALQPAGGQAAVAGAFWPGWVNARAIVTDGGSGGWTLDGWGGLHPFGGTARIGNEAYWQGWDIARGAVRIPVPNSGYTLDGWGGVHPFGSAPPITFSGYWQGWDIARGITVRSDGLGGWVLDGWGGLHPFGTAGNVATTGYWQGWDIARAVAVRPDGSSGYVLDGWGGIHPFGGAPPMQTSRYTRGSDEMRSLVLTADGNGGYVVDLNGYVWPVGNAPYVKLSGTWIGTGLSRGLAIMN
jgi:hypothetical protein